MKRNPPLAEATALLVMPASHQPQYREALHDLGVAVHAAEDCRQAREHLQTSPAFRVVITDVTLSDGNWCDVLRMATDLEVPASVVVATPEINQTLWSEVFWRGAYDLITQPCDWNDLHTCLEGALRPQRFMTRFPNLALSA